MQYIPNKIATTYCRNAMLVLMVYAMKQITIDKINTLLEHVDYVHV